MEPELLKERLSQGNFIGFLGAGYSMRAGYPNWPNLLVAIAEKVCPEAKSLVDKHLAEGRYLKAADHFVRASN